MRGDGYILRLARRIKRYFHAMQGRDFFVFPSKNAKTTKLKRLGTSYGGWTCNADEIQKSSIVYSFGVGMDISFDLELIALRNCKIHAFDPSADSADWIQTQSVDKRFCFYAYGLGGVDGELAFRKPNIRGYYSPSAVFSFRGRARICPSIP